MNAEDRSRRITDAELELRKLTTYDEPSESQKRRIGVLRDEIRSLELDAIADAEQDRNRDHARLSAFVGTGDVRHESGTPHTAYHAPELMQRADSPWNSDPMSLTYQATRTTSQKRGEARHAIERSVAPDRVKHFATSLVDVADDAEATRLGMWAKVTSDPNYRAAFAELFNDPEHGSRMWTDEMREAVRRTRTYARAMNLTDSSGGYLVPFELDPTIRLTNSGTQDPMRRVAKVQAVTTDVYYYVSSAGVTAEWTAEAAEAADASPTLSQPSIPNYKGDTFVPFSIELGMDSNLSEQVAALMVDAKQRKEATAFINGSGVGQATGIVTALVGGSSEVKTLTDNAFVQGDVYGLQNVLPARYQANASWQSSIAIINKMRQFDVSTTGNQPLVQNGLAGGAPLTLLGWGLDINSNMDSAVSTNNSYILLVGDFSQYVITDRVGTTIELIPHLVGPNRRPTGQRGYYMYFRTGADSINDGAFRLLNTNAS